MSHRNQVQIRSPNVSYDDTFITASYEYETCKVEGDVVLPEKHKLTFRTEKTVPKLGMMLVGWGGNNGTTVTAGILANRNKITWRTKEGLHHPDYFGSITQASTVKMGSDANGNPVYIPMKSMLPMVDPNDIVIGGWDISSMDLAKAMERAEVLDYDLQRQLAPLMKDMVPLPSIYSRDFIALNQADRADNVIPGNKRQQLETIRRNIREFKIANGVDKVVVLWTATTERFSDILAGTNDSAENILKAIENDHSEISPSTIFAVASILEGCTYINGSPQNTFVPGVIELAERENVLIAGDDFKSGQTKMKSVLVDFLVSAGIKPVSIVSYNHLGNNDGKNLSEPSQFRSKEITKSNVVDDMVASNQILYKEGEHPDHCVVIKYVPYVKDSKRAMDEYTSEIFLGGKNTIVLHNTCEDSLLASPLIIDLVILAELCERIKVKPEGEENFTGFYPVLSILSYLMKAPLVPRDSPVVNALSAQRQCIVNTFRACLGLGPENYMLLEHKFSSLINSSNKRQKL